MDTLIPKIRSDHAAAESQISQLNADIEKQASKIRDAAANMTAIEMLRKVPEMLEDLKVNNEWLHIEQEKSATLRSYLDRAGLLNRLAATLDDLTDEEMKSVVSYVTFLKSQR
ncbi:MAG: hypothetical protein E7572_12880 [Ruminococcaceae bacterium]|jgi:hypothetical protein|nr:hypothetical protein [Oscillospiraceae bacterium]